MKPSDIDVKRPKTIPQKQQSRLYPVLSDIDSNCATTESDNNGTTATLSDEEEEDEFVDQHRHRNFDKYQETSADDRWDKMMDCFLFCFCLE